MPKVDQKTALEFTLRFMTWLVSESLCTNLFSCPCVGKDFAKQNWATRKDQDLSLDPGQTEIFSTVAQIQPLL